MIFNKYPKITFATSTKSDGNMSFMMGNTQEALKNRVKFLSSLEINLNQTVSLKQIHSNKVIKVTRNHLTAGAFPDSNIIEADGLITNEQNLFLMIKSGDCHQLGLYDPKHNVIGLIHAGRKGLEVGIISEAIRQLKSFFKVDSKDLLVQFGPSIGPCCYDIDIWSEAEKQLQKMGVLKKNIDNPKICTYHKDEYFSHRQFVKENLKDDFRFLTVFGMRK